MNMIFSRIFDTHNSPQTPKRAGTTHLRHTLYTTFVHTLYTSTIPIIVLIWHTFTLGILDIYLNTIIACLYVSLLV
jgi:hypothetical protein